MLIEISQTEKVSQLHWIVVTISTVLDKKEAHITESLQFLTLFPQSSLPISKLHSQMM
jgi:hypothetical protein